MSLSPSDSETKAIMVRISIHQSELKGHLGLDMGVRDYDVKVIL